jgi:hypothetical protein
MNGHFRHRNPNESEYEEIGPPKHRAGEYFSVRLISNSFTFSSYGITERVLRYSNSTFRPYAGAYMDR